MSRFLILDSGLTGAAGPRLTYITACLRAAEQAGMQPIVAAHRKCHSASGLGELAWETLPVFADPVREEDALDVVTRAPEARRSEDAGGDFRSERLSGGVAWRSGVPHQATAFYHGCQRLLDHVVFERGDQVFVPFATPFHFLGLCKFLHQAPTTRSAQWHVQFPADLEQSSLTEGSSAGVDVRAWWPLFAKALGLAHDRNLSLFTPSPALTTQYNQLGLALFETLPPHVGHELAPTAWRPAHAPLKLLCVGPWEHAWPRQQLSRIVLDLWHDHVTTQALRMSVLRGAGAGRWLPMGGGTDGAEAHDAVIREVDPPATLADYLSLLQDSDAALLLFEPRTTRYRVPALFPELVAAGVPVLVPHGTLMAGQLAETSRRANEVPPRARGRADDTDADPAGLPPRPPVNQAGYDPESLSHVLRDLLENHGRYRRDAAHLGQVWRRLHTPRATLRRILSGRRFLWAAPAA